MARVTRLEPEGARSRRWVIELDGDPWRRLPRVAVRKLGLELEDEVSPDQLTEQLLRMEPELARERSLYLVSARERSSAEVVRKLADDGFADPVSRDVVRDLVLQGLVDDERYAEMLTRSLVSGRGYGRGRVSRELMRRGVPAEVASAALEASCPAEDELDRALETARRMARGRSVGTQKLAARLARRGFAAGVAFAAARAVAGEDERPLW